MDSTTRSLVIAIGVLLVVALSLSTLTGGMMGPGLWRGGFQGQGWMWGLRMGLGGVTMLLFWGAVIAGVVLVVRSLNASPSTGANSTPLEVAKRRYAAGEITRDEYEQIRKDLAE